MYKAYLFLCSFFVLLSCTKEPAENQPSNSTTSNGQDSISTPPPLSIPATLTGTYYGTLYTSVNTSGLPPWQAPEVYENDSFTNCTAFLSFQEYNTAIVTKFLDANNDTIPTTEFYTIVDPGTDTTQNPWVITSAKSPCKLVTYRYSQNDSMHISLGYVCSGYHAATTYNFKGKKQ